MANCSSYESKPVDPYGRIDWSEEDITTWQQLMERQLSCIEGKACKEYCAGLELLDLPTKTIPNIGDINQVLRQSTGWQCEPVAALIDFDRFFRLLAEKKFPVATFLRSRDDFDYLQEPDFFHEIFGHCAMLTNPSFAAFTQKYGQLGLGATKQQRVYLARLYWFTVEFGLLEHDGRRQIYGGGILSSPAETDYAFNSTKAIRKPLDIVDVMRTPYRIDVMQPIYFTLDHLDRLFEFTQMDLMACVEQAAYKGLHKPLYLVE